MTDTATARQITITRVFDAPREAVWKAWTEPAQLARWWGKRGWSTPPSTVTMDVRPGGAFRLNSINDEEFSEMSAIRELGRPGRPGLWSAHFNRPDGNGWAVQEISETPTSRS